MSKKNEAMVFYGTWLEATSFISENEGMKLIKAIINYGISCTEPKLTGATKGMFEIIRPQIDANRKRYENGKLGGRPSKPEELGEREKLIKSIKKEGKNNGK